MARVRGVTFKDVAENLAFIKVIWNGKVVYDDSSEYYTVDDFISFKTKYENRKVKKITVDVIKYHSCILTVEGEE